MRREGRNILAVCMLHDGAEGEPARECHRRHGRVRITTTDCSLGKVVDLSRSGMRVVTGKGLKPGERPMRVSLDAGDGRMKVWCRVAWVYRRGLRKREVGLEFVDVSDEQARCLGLLARTAAGNSHMSSRIYDRTG